MCGLNVPQDLCWWWSILSVCSQSGLFKKDIQIMLHLCSQPLHSILSSQEKSKILSSGPQSPKGINTCSPLLLHLILWLVHPFLVTAFFFLTIPQSHQTKGVSSQWPLACPVFTLLSLECSRQIVTSLTVSFLWDLLLKYHLLRNDTYPHAFI